MKEFARRAHEANVSPGTRPEAAGRSSGAGHQQHPKVENQDSQHMPNQPRGSFPDCYRFRQGVAGMCRWDVPGFGCAAGGLHSSCTTFVAMRLQSCVSKAVLMSCLVGITGGDQTNFYIARNEGA